MPTHALLHFEVDQTVCTLHVKRIIHPPLFQLKEGSTCRVRWSGRKHYDATVLCLGKNLSHIFPLLAVNLSCLPGDAGLVTERKNEWVVSHLEKEEEDTMEQPLPKDVVTTSEAKAEGGQGCQGTLHDHT